MAKKIGPTEIAFITAQWKTGKWQTYSSLGKYIGYSDKTVRRCVLNSGLTPTQVREPRTEKPCGCQREGCLVERRPDEPWHRFRDRKFRSEECRPHQRENQSLYHALDYPQGGAAFLQRLEAVHGRWKGRPYDH